jgi:CDP-paratose 2-epimerase
VTGSAGLIGSEAAAHFANQGLDVVGVDNGMRSYFFGPEASTQWNQERLTASLGARYRHVAADIRDAPMLNRLFAEHGKDIALVVHTAAQPSHDWAAREPITDFGVNAVGTLNLLEATRQHAPDAAFVFTSTNKVYGDRPNGLPLIELEDRWEIDSKHPFHAEGIPESMSIDESTHSIFGASKVAADVLVQEYGRYFGMRTACFRGGCLTGPNHSGAQLHGFLAYLMKCAATGRPYTVFGYKGKQVRDNIHSTDLIRAFDAFFRAPQSAKVYNIGGGRFSNCSMIEAIRMCEEITGRPMRWDYTDANRTGDHIWWVSDLTRFKSDYPDWKLEYDVHAILREMYDLNRERWESEAPPQSAVSA